MNEKTTYTKLSNLVDDTFTILETYGYTFKKWNDEAKRFEQSDQWQEGFSKSYSVKTDKGMLDLSTGQISQLLEAVYYKGQSDINNKTFKVKSNGQTGKDIRYFLNAAKSEATQPLTQKQVFDEIVVDDIDDNLLI